MSDLLSPQYKHNHVMDQSLYNSFSFIREMSKDIGLRNTVWNRILCKQRINFTSTSVSLKKNSFSQVIDFMHSLSTEQQDLVPVQPRLNPTPEDINMNTLILNTPTYVGVDDDVDVDFFMDKYFGDVTKLMREMTSCMRNMDKFMMIVMRFVNLSKIVLDDGCHLMIVGDDGLFSRMYMYCAYFAFHLWHRLQVEIVPSICDGYTWSLTVELTDEDRERFDTYWMSIIKNCLSFVSRSSAHVLRIRDIIVVNEKVAHTIMMGASCTRGTKCLFASLPTDIIYRIFQHAYPNKFFTGLGAESIKLLQRGDDLSLCDMLNALMIEFKLSM